MNGVHSSPIRPIGRLCLVVGMLSLGVLTPALASHDIRFEMPAPARGFDGNGLDDLAVGVPFEDIESKPANVAGAVQVLYSAAPDGLTADGDQFWYQSGSGLKDSSEANDQFGRALAAGDFDGDGRADLAVGVPFEDVSGQNSAGLVQVLYASPVTRMLSASDQTWTQADLHLPGAEGVEANDRLGSALAAGDFDGDRYCDLLISSPYETWGGIGATGVVHLLYGSATGLTGAGTQFWHQGMTTVPGENEAGDWFGYALAAGDFNGDGFADAAIGTPHDDAGAVDGAGTVVVMYGGVGGLSTTGIQQWHQDSPGPVEGGAEAGDWFGAVLATGDFDGDGFDDLAVGVPYEDVEAVTDNAGAVNVLYGSAGGITGVGDQMWHQNNSGVLDDPEPNDAFGWALVAGDFNADGYDELAVGIPYEDIGAAASGVNAGAVQVFNGSATGLAALDTALWHQSRGNVAESNQANDNFGLALAAGCFTPDAYADLAVGVPYEDISGANDVGTVVTLHGSSGGLTDAHSDYWRQGSGGVADAAEAGDRFGYVLAATGPIERHVYLPTILQES